MMTRCKIEGTELNFRTNEQVPVTGPSVIFIHGSGADHTVWEQQFEAFESACRYFALDLPGHGSSGGSGEQEIDRYVEWIRKFILTLNLNRPVLVGHSLGAAICLAFAVQHEEMLSGAVPVSGGVRMPVNDLILEGIKKDPIGTANLTWKFAVAKQNREKLSYRLEKNLASMKPEISYGDFLACSKLDLTDAISKIRIPVLAVCGKEDKMTPEANSRFIADHIEGAEIALIENAGHLVMLENPEAFNAALLGFLNKLK